MLFMAMSATAPPFILLTDKKWIFKILTICPVVVDFLNVSEKGCSHTLYTILMYVYHDGGESTFY